MSSSLRFRDGANLVLDSDTGVVACRVMPSPFSAARPIARQFAETVKAGGNDVQANISSMEGYIAVRVFVEDLKRAGSKITRESLIAGLEVMGSHDVGRLSSQLQPDHHVASSLGEMSMLTGDGRIRT